MSDKCPGCGMPYISDPIYLAPPAEQPAVVKRDKEWITELVVALGFTAPKAILATCPDEVGECIQSIQAAARAEGLREASTLLWGLIKGPVDDWRGLRARVATKLRRLATEAEKGAK